MQFFYINLCNCLNTGNLQNIKKLAPRQFMVIIYREQMRDEEVFTLSMRSIYSSIIPYRVIVQIQSVMSIPWHVAALMASFCRRITLRQSLLPTATVSCAVGRGSLSYHNIVGVFSRRRGSVRICHQIA